MPTRHPLITLLSEAGAYDARRLKFTVPAGLLDLLSREARVFVLMFLSDQKLNIDDLINDQWRNDPKRKTYYQRLSTNARLEIHVLIGFVLHETIHQIDLLISPFGLSYLSILIEEYLCLQSLVPRVMDEANFRELFPILNHVGMSVPTIIQKCGLQKDWLHLEEIIRKAIAWGDVASRTPKAREVELGWDADFAQAGPFFGTDDQIEPVRVFGFSFWTFRLQGQTNCYLRPTTILETKALAGTMLYLLEIAPHVRDVWRYYDSVYYSVRDRLTPDYLIILDILSRQHRHRDFADVLSKGSRESIRSVLLIAQSLCWSALQAPPLLAGAGRTTSLGGNPVIRLFCGLFNLGEVVTKWEPGLPMTGTSLLNRLEQHVLFAGLDQLPIAEVYNRSVEALSALETRVEAIWHPDVRAHFKHVLSIMKAPMTSRGPRYDSRLGQPETGNPRPSAGPDIELFYHDHTPKGGYSEWLDLRDDVLFKHLPLDDGMLRRLYEHFEAPLALVPCDDCRGLHQFLVSRFADRHQLKCPTTGAPIEIIGEQVRHIAIGSD